MMTPEERWKAIDDFVHPLVKTDQALDAALDDSIAAGLPAINVSAAQGKFLMLLAQIQGARSILEIGTLGGYSTIWLARALPADGRLISLEYEAKHVEVARANLARAGVADRVEVIHGKAIETLPRLAEQKKGPFDLIFIDADKQSTTEYFGWALKLSRPGSVIVVDNVVRKGAVLDADSTDVNVQGMRRFFEAASKETRVSMTVLQTVGSKGYDGFALARVMGG
jgi:predicted O-methyltransferase YrrM